MLFLVLAKVSSLASFHDCFLQIPPNSWISVSMLLALESQATTAVIQLLIELSSSNQWFFNEPLDSLLPRAELFLTS